MRYLSPKRCAESSWFFVVRILLIILLCRKNFGTANHQTLKHLEIHFFYKTSAHHFQFSRSYLHKEAESIFSNIFQGLGQCVTGRFFLGRNRRRLGTVQGKLLSIKFAYRRRGCKQIVVHMHMFCLFPIGNENLLSSQHCTHFILPSEFRMFIHNGRNRSILDNYKIK